MALILDEHSRDPERLAAYIVGLERQSAGATTALAIRSIRIKDLESENQNLAEVNTKLRDRLDKAREIVVILNQKIQRVNEKLRSLDLNSIDICEIFSANGL